MGNLRSVQKGFEKVGFPAEITSRPSDLTSASHVVLPGVGAFADAIAELTRLDFVNAIKDVVSSSKPFLGICLGLQLLFEVSYEDGEHEGLGILPGKVVRFRESPGLKIPQIGWNNVTRRTNHPVFANAPTGTYFYFVHSYCAAPSDPNIVALTADYPDPFCAAIARNSLVATQFHPEKSQKDGLALLRNFAKWNLGDVSD